MKPWFGHSPCVDNRHGLSCLCSCAFPEYALGCLQWILGMKDRTHCILKLIFFYGKLFEAKTNLVCINCIRDKKISPRVHEITFEDIFTLLWVTSHTIKIISYSWSDLLPSVSWLWNKINLSPLIQDRCIIVPNHITEIKKVWWC